MAHYFDASALVKLIVVEPESAGLRKWLADAHRPAVSSDLTLTDVLRAVRRSAPERAGIARRVLEPVTFSAVTREICERAALLAPPPLRTLDAIHLATALELGDDLDGLVTYDDRLGSAARDAGISTVAPR
ncbi:type II toxin-antitoxin system VapC family toxin [Candidatus Poriferisodalis sp.]|uniref:type II toxin-antitoxin system VapC family toxin n=1 Tax=Candidatus Poriferisodalis sp. TaxID=3101277 RepID=UPI003C6F00AD